MKLYLKIFLLSVILLVYLIGSMRIYIPYVNYQLNQQYYASVLCENKNLEDCKGQCFVKKEVKNAAEEESDSLTTPIQKFEEIPALNYFLFDNRLVGDIQVETPLNSQFVILTTLSVPSPPPKV